MSGHKSRQRARRRWGRPVRLAVGTLGILAALTIATEGTLRGIGWWYQRSHHWVLPSDLHPDEEVILCLGESTTIGIWGDFSESYPKQLEGLLNQRHGANRYLAIVPNHVGQNSSQLAHRVNGYLEAYDPKLMILMSGANNMWSLAESSVVRFLQGGSISSRRRIRVAVALHDFRTHKLLRWIGQRLFSLRLNRPADLDHREMLGYPVLANPPDPALTKAIAPHQAAFIQAWRYDMERIITAALARDIPVVMMTYPVMDRFVPPTEFEQMAQRFELPLVRNDLVLQELARQDGFRPETYAHPNQSFHPNTRGYGVIARSVLDTIVENRLLQPL